MAGAGYLLAQEWAALMLSLALAAVRKFMVTELQWLTLPYSSPKNQVHAYGYHLNVSSAITMQYMNMIIINVHGRVKLGDTGLKCISHTVIVR